MSTTKECYFVKECFSPPHGSCPRSRLCSESRSTPKTPTIRDKSYVIYASCETRCRRALSSSRIRSHGVNHPAEVQDTASRCLIAVVVEGDAVEFLERIDKFACRGRKARVQGNAFDPRGTDVDTVTFFDVSKIGCFDPSSLVRNHWRFHMTKQRPLGRAEEGMDFDV